MKVTQNYHIPANFTDTGRLFGLFGIRKAIKALLLAVPVTGILLGGFALIGIRDDPLSRFLAILWRWRRNRRGEYTGGGSGQRAEKRDGAGYADHSRRGQQEGCGWRAVLDHF